MAIAIRQENKTANLDRKEKTRIKNRLEKILCILRCDDAYLSILFTSPERMKELNKKWRGENRPARILSFPQEDHFAGDVMNVMKGMKKGAGGEAPFRVLGDLAIRDDKPGISDRLLVHGVLHLLGYTHETEKNYEKMRKKEKEILSALKR